MTRYRIDHNQQTRKMCSGVTMEELVPCCTCGEDEEEEEERPVSWFWYIMGSELLLFTLHMSAVTLGVVKVHATRFSVYCSFGRVSVHLVRTSIDIALDLSCISLQQLVVSILFFSTHWSLEKESKLVGADPVSQNCVFRVASVK